MVLKEEDFGGLYSKIPISFEKSLMNVCGLWNLLYRVREDCILLLQLPSAFWDGPASCQEFAC